MTMVQQAQAARVPRHGSTWPGRIDPAIEQRRDRTSENTTEKPTSRIEERRMDGERWGVSQRD